MSDRANKSLNSAAVQRDRLVHRLRQTKRATTLQLRDEEDILHPPGRVRELRKQGFDISMSWVPRATQCGVVHRVGQYELHSEPSP
jgi:hypothetical protein